MCIVVPIDSLPNFYKRWQSIYALTVSIMTVRMIDMPEPLKNKQKEKAVKQAMKLLIAEGLINESQLAS